MTRMSLRTRFVSGLVGQGRSEGMNVFVRCESCVKKCKHRNEVNRTTGDTVDGCIVNERDVDKYTKGTNNG